MAKKRNKGGREARKVTEAGISLIAFGLLFLVLPLIVGRSPLVQALLHLRSVAGWMMAGGAALLLLGWGMARISAARGSGPASPGPEAPRQAKARPARAETLLDAAPDLPAGRREPVMAAAPLRPDAWSEQVFDVIEWRRFEAVVERLFQQAGFETTSQSHGADEGVDIWLYSRHQPGEPVSLVQCKHWRGKRVGVDKVRELRGVMAARSVRRGQFATTSGFTPDAVAFARDNGIHLLDVARLLDLIRTRTPEQQSELLAVALEGDYWRPTCVNCGIKMIDRQPRGGGAAFWGCTRFPDCRTTLPMRAG